MSSALWDGSVRSVARSINSHLHIFSNIFPGIGGIPSATTTDWGFAAPALKEVDDRSVPKSRDGSVGTSAVRLASTGKVTPTDK